MFLYLGFLQSRSSGFDLVCDIDRHWVRSAAARRKHVCRRMVGSGRYQSRERARTVCHRPSETPQTRPEPYSLALRACKDDCAPSPGSWYRCAWPCLTPVARSCRIALYVALLQSKYAVDVSIAYAASLNRPHRKREALNPQKREPVLRDRSQ